MQWHFLQLLRRGLVGPVPYGRTPGAFGARADLVGATLVVARAEYPESSAAGRDKPFTCGPRRRFHH
ncbi:MAG: hypothetical protein OXH09_20285 [Gammaproteobacteria bacterium]|nr:hypothetical protein [Gammaproteobacteria bacterium]